MVRLYMCLPAGVGGQVVVRLYMCLPAGVGGQVVVRLYMCLPAGVGGQVVVRLYMCLPAGVGGQVDFIRGAALGLDGLGKPILAMPSVTSKGESKVVPFLKQGTEQNNMSFCDCLMRLGLL